LIASFYFKFSRRPDKESEMFPAKEGERGEPNASRRGWGEIGCVGQPAPFQKAQHATKKASGGTGPKNLTCCLVRKNRGTRIQNVVRQNEALSTNSEQEKKSKGGVKNWAFRGKESGQLFSSSTLVSAGRKKGDWKWHHLTWRDSAALSQTHKF